MGLFFIFIFCNYYYFLLSELMNHVYLLERQLCLLLFYFSTQSYEVHLGAQNIYNNTDPSLVVATTTVATLHQQYNGNNLHNDIALVFLPTPVTFTASKLAID
jgi:hypothetical protein